MIEQILGKSSTHSLKLFSKEEIDWLEKRVFQRQTKKGKEYAVKCIVREKDIKLTHVRQMCMRNAVFVCTFSAMCMQEWQSAYTF